MPVAGCSSANYAAHIFDWFKYHYWAGGLALNVWLWMELVWPSEPLSMA